MIHSDQLHETRGFWWARHDLLTYKVPIEEGGILLPSYYLVPGFIPDTTAIWYKFVHGRKDNRRIGDFSGLFDSIFFVNVRAKEMFSDMFEKHGRIYPIRCSNEIHFLVLIDTLHNAIDLKRSEFDRSEIEERVEDDISRFFEVTLKPGFTTDDDIFRLSGSFFLNTVLIVSNRFKKRYEENGFTGLKFKATNGKLQG